MTRRGSSASAWFSDLIGSECLARSGSVTRAMVAADQSVCRVVDRFPDGSSEGELPFCLRRPVLGDTVYMPIGGRKVNSHWQSFCPWIYP